MEAWADVGEFETDRGVEWTGLTGWRPAGLEREDIEECERETEDPQVSRVKVLKAREEAWRGGILSVGGINLLFIPSVPQIYNLFAHVMERG